MGRSWSRTRSPRSGGSSHVFAGEVASLLPRPSTGHRERGREPAELCPVPRRVPRKGCCPQTLPRVRDPDGALGGSPGRTAFFRILLWGARPTVATVAGPETGVSSTRNSPAPALSVSPSAERVVPPRPGEPRLPEGRLLPEPAGPNLTSAPLNAPKPRRTAGPPPLPGTISSPDPAAGAGRPYLGSRPPPRLPVQDSPGLGLRRCPSVHAGGKLRPERPGPA